ncbi:MAG: PAS domain-containing protein [Candidatus Thorarchaeota archaeon]|jgi:hypothetical protein
MNDIEGSGKVKKALWDMINYSNLFAIILDEDINIKLINYCLAIALGFESEQEPIGRCWLDFIDEPKKEMIKYIHRRVIEEDPKFTETITDVLLPNKTLVPVRWFNSHINHEYKWTFSIGFPLIEVSIEDSVDSMRSYFKDIIKRDRTMIESLRDVSIEKI